MRTHEMNADDETDITEIEVLADGRICVFGASLEVLEALDQVQGGTDRSIRDRLAALSRPAAATLQPAALSELGDD